MLLNNLCMLMVGKVYAAGDVTSAAETATGTLQTIAITVAVIALVGVGISMITTGLNGTPAEMTISNARQRLVGIAIGLALALLAPTFTTMVFNPNSADQGAGWLLTTPRSVQPAPDNITWQDIDNLFSPDGDVVNVTPNENTFGDTPADNWINKLVDNMRGETNE